MTNKKEKSYDILRKVRQVELRARMLLDSALCGNYHSVFKGQGVHFEEVRDYCIGDEIRFIDWNVTAKTNKPFVKVFREERELTVLLAIDVSKSCSWSSSYTSKREFAAEVASVLAFSAAKNNDKIGLILFSNNIELFIPPAKGQQHLLRIIREILFFEPKDFSTDISAVIKAMSTLQKKKAIVGLFSDFIPSINRELVVQEWLSALSRLNRNHDLICVKLEDEREKTIPNVGYVAIEDLETGQSVYVDTKVASRSFCKESSNLSEKFYTGCKKFGVDLVKLTNGKPYLAMLQSFFKARKRR